ncbi:MAG: DUF4265 domain-containing protein [Thermosynechococcaceae cyanobacterium MS004]|nr:DUF4265 domain-containing protein [Thermosynechococcaceae cyanobacterium MS004]
MSQKVNVDMECGYGPQPIWVTKVGENLYRIEDPNLLWAYEDAMYHDVVEAWPQIDDTLLFQRVVEKSSWRCIFPTLGPVFWQSEAFELYLRHIEAVGGLWHIDMEGVIFIYMPPEVDFDPHHEAHKIWNRLYPNSPL